jgi:hypothetical protein
MKKLTVIALVMLSNVALAQCYSANNQSADDNEPVFARTNNPQLDYVMGREVNALKTFFRVNPPVFYYQDDPHNAFFNPATGNVKVGINLITEEYNTYRNITTVPIIMAHEFGHCVDRTLSAVSSDGINRELYADFLAGCFLRYRLGFVWTDINGVLVSFFNKGDDLPINDPHHHGSQVQRLNTIRAGFNWYSSHLSGSVSAMSDAAKNYLGISGSYDPGTRSTPSSSYSASKVRVISTRLQYPAVNGSMVTMSYSVRVSNQNDYPVTATIGGLSYGYYSNCDGSASNFVRDGDFEEQTVDVAANSSATVILTVTVRDYHPNNCAGVLQNRSAKVISVERN